MDVLVVCDSGVERHDVMELPRLLDSQDAVIWVDIPACDEVAVEMLSGVFGFHRIALHDCVERNHVSKVHIYPDHVFTVLHAPQPGQRGHVHYVELDQFIGRNYLVTVHGPLNPAVDPQVAFLDTGAVRRRIEEKNLHISSPFELSHWIVSALIRRESDLVANLARESGELEQRVMLGEDLDDPEEFLEELFQAWYRLRGRHDQRPASAKRPASPPQCAEKTSRSAPQQAAASPTPRTARVGCCPTRQRSR